MPLTPTNSNPNPIAGNPIVAYGGGAEDIAALQNIILLTENDIRAFAQKYKSKIGVCIPIGTHAEASQFLFDSTIWGMGMAMIKTPDLIDFVLYKYNEYAFIRYEISTHTKTGLSYSPTANVWDQLLNVTLTSSTATSFTLAHPWNNYRNLIFETGNYRNIWSQMVVDVGRFATMSSGFRPQIIGPNGSTTISVYPNGTDAVWVAGYAFAANHYFRILGEY